MMPAESLVDIAVSQAKFNNEIDQYRQNQEDYIRLGWWLVKAEFPEVFVIFGTRHTQLTMAPFGAIINFSNYYLWAPSVRLVNPFTGKPYFRRELPFPHMLRRRLMPSEGNSPPRYQTEDLLQEDSNALPFICVPGVREYHEHPAHSGDSWLMHRGRGEGSLYFLLNLLGTYGADAIKGCGFNIQLSLQTYSTEEEVPL